MEILDQIHYDIWVVDENGNKLRSYAQEIGKNNLFNEFGQVHHLIPVNEKAGLVRYAIFVHGTGAEQENPDVSMAGYAIIEINVEKNPLLEKFNEVNNDVKTNIVEIPEWIKNNAGWWAEGIIDDEAFVNGIQYLIEHGIIQT